MSLVVMGQAARAAAFELAVTSTACKNQALFQNHFWKIHNKVEK